MMEPDLFWFPWCTSVYIESFVKEKVAELKASGRYWDVCSDGGRIYVQVARNPFGIGYLTKKEWEEGVG